MWSFIERIEFNTTPRIRRESTLVAPETTGASEKEKGGKQERRKTGKAENRKEWRTLKPRALTTM